MTRRELGIEINWAGGWQEFHQRRKDWDLYYYWTERYNALRKEYEALGERKVRARRIDMTYNGENHMVVGNDKPESKCPASGGDHDWQPVFSCDASGEKKFNCDACDIAPKGVGIRMMCPHLKTEFFCDDCGVRAED